MPSLQTQAHGIRYYVSINYGAQATRQTFRTTETKIGFLFYVIHFEDIPSGIKPSLIRDGDESKWIYQL